MIVHLGDFTALALRQGLYNIPYNEGDDITSVVVENVYDEEKHRYKILLSLTPIYDNFAKIMKKASISYVNTSRLFIMKMQFLYWLPMTIFYF